MEPNDKRCNRQIPADGHVKKYNSTISLDPERQDGKKRKKARSIRFSVNVYVFLQYTNTPVYKTDNNKFSGEHGILGAKHTYYSEIKDGSLSFKPGHDLTN